jgi:hypothetical protein
MLTYITVEDILEAVFSVWSIPRLYHKDHWDILGLQLVAGRDLSEVVADSCPLAGMWEMEESPLFEVLHNSAK